MSATTKLRIYNALRARGLGPASAWSRAINLVARFRIGDFTFFL